jgi:hypothetical protein
MPVICQEQKMLVLVFVCGSAWECTIVRVTGSKKRIGNELALLDAKAVGCLCDQSSPCGYARRKVIAAIPHDLAKAEDICCEEVSCHVCLIEPVII